MLTLISDKKTNEINNICQSEIPCRVSNIAQDSGDTIPMTGSNRWNPNDVCTGASRAIPRVRFEATRFPVTTQGLRSLDGLATSHNTPALTSKSDENLSWLIVVR